jgi:ABC-type branched-subunit amino acid transport system ATPase component
MLSVQGVRKSFGGVAAVDGASLTLLSGKITGLIGPNGAGKTTLFNLISGTVAAEAGTIALGGRDVTAFAVEGRARAGISRTFQLARPFRNLTVREHLALALEHDDDAVSAIWNKGTETEVMRWLARVGLDVSPDTRAADLSYGQGKLLGIAMAIAHPHSVLLMDEPVAGVNPVLRERIAELLRSLRAEGETILLIEHDMGFVMPLADHVYVMDHGRMIAQGTPEEVRRDPAVLSAYLGEQL